MALLHLSLLLTLFGHPSHARVLQWSPVHSPPAELFRRGDDPADFSWVKNFGVIGDSFTAGIGAGTPLGVYNTETNEAWKCSRYSAAYPMVIKEEIGSHIDDFRYPACSGDRSTGIFDQIDTLKEDTNFVVMTAGGNDLCLAGMITKCVISAYSSEKVCKQVMDKAQENIDTILKPNLVQILTKLDKKMAKDGIVIYNGYARFFNTDKEKCGNDEMWLFPKTTSTEGLKLTIERRKKFNDLVIQINNVIKSAINKVADDVSYNLGFSNWDHWPIEVDGQFCDPDGSGKYPDPDQPNLQFFKMNTEKEAYGDGVSEKRWLGPRRIKETPIYDTLLYKSINPPAEALHKLDKRAPSVPNCPGDDEEEEDSDSEAGGDDSDSDGGDLRKKSTSKRSLEDWGIGVPDSIGKIFHPNKLGHLTIASFALAKAMDMRAKILGQESTMCKVQDEFKCWSDDEDAKAYATATRLDDTVKEFCTGIDNDGDVGSEQEKTYDEGTPDEHVFKITRGSSRSLSARECYSTMRRIIHGCDTDKKKNPMNWKYGGKYLKNEDTYEVTPKRERPPLIKEAYGKCKGKYKFLFGQYTVHGAGWCSWDSGDEFKDSADDCLGGGLTDWSFEYFDEPDEDGYEWKAKFKTPVWSRARCFDNNKAQFGANGFTDGCSGND